MNGESTVLAAPKKNRAARESKDGQWLSFPKVPNLIQYVSSGNYYGRVKTNGKVIRKSLETTVWTTAKLRLVDFLKEQQAQADSKNCPNAMFAEAEAAYSAAVQQNAKMKPRSKEYCVLCVAKIKETWSALWKMKLEEISPSECLSWAAELRKKKISGQYFNNIIGTLKRIIAIGIKAHVRSGGRPFENPAADIQRTRVKQRAPKLPERDQFKRIVESVRLKSGGWGHKAGDLIEFLAYSGLRLNTEAQWVTWEDVDWERKEIVVRGDPETHTKNWEIRRIPIIPDMDMLLRRMRDERGGNPTGKIVQVSRCPECLDRACKEVGVEYLRHHDLRHLFATRCIEAGVDIPTVARWLGHKDGGALAMKTYGHLRNEHSRAMAERVRF